MTDLVKIEKKIREVFSAKLKNISTHLESGSNKGDGYAGVIIRALVVGDEDGVQKKYDVIAKCVPSNLDIRKVMPITGAFKREYLFYEKIVPYYLKIQNQLNIPEESRLVLPEYYSGSDEYGSEFLILNNLKPLGYAMIICPDAVDYEHTALTLRALGKFHAVSVAFKEQYPTEFKNIIPELTRDVLYESYNEYNTSGVVYYADKSYEKFLDNIKNSELKQRVMKAIGPNLSLKIQSFYLAGNKKIISHGDCWFNNMMFKYQDGRPVGHVLLDFQILRYTSMANDLMTFMGVAGEKKLRTNFWQLMDVYYDSFCEYMTILKFDPQKFCTKEQFYDEVKGQLIFGLGMKIFAMPFFKSGEILNPFELFSKIYPESFFRHSEDYVRCVNETVEYYVEIGSI